MNELNYPFDSDFILKKRKSLKKALKAPGGVQTGSANASPSLAVLPHMTSSKFWSFFC